MCGIFGYLNYQNKKCRRQIIDTLTAGLQRLEYRGYDSAGIAFDSDAPAAKDASSTQIVKRKGRVNDLIAKIKDEPNIDFDREFVTHFGIAHTRWATHGEPNDINSHPHSSGPENEFVVVHNGVITNCRHIEKFLQAKGYRQISQTDTELIVLLMKYFYDKHSDSDKKLNFVCLTNMVLEFVEGAYALLIKCSHFPNEAIATKKSSPLLIGVRLDSTDTAIHVPIISQPDICRSGELSSVAVHRHCFSPDAGVDYFFSSDASAVVEHTKRVIYLEDEDVAHVQDGFLNIYRHMPLVPCEGVLFEEALTLHLELQQIMKGSYDTYMEKEIFEQPDSLVNTMRGRVDFLANTITLGGLRSHLAAIHRCRRIIFVGCGTSYYSCVAVRQIMEELTDLPIMNELASDMLDRSMPVFRDDVCVFVSQSGETADTLNALRYCKGHGALLLGVTNVVGSTICRETDCGINLNAGPEIGVASTKAYTSQIVALTLFACLLGADSVSKRPKIAEILAALRELPLKVKECLKLSDRIKALATIHYTASSCLLVGRGGHTATCLEGALKVKEISYIHSEGIQSGELKHGPLALVDDKILIIAIITDCKIFSKCVNALEQITARGAKPLVLTDCLEKLRHVSDGNVLEIPHTIDCLQAVVAIVPLQLLALHLAKLRGHDVDCPRNLAKSVTVE